jgi:hypothetical protein
LVKSSHLYAPKNKRLRVLSKLESLLDSLSSEFRVLWISIKVAWSKDVKEKRYLIFCVWQPYKIYIWASLGTGFVTILDSYSRERLGENWIWNLMDFLLSLPLFRNFSITLVWFSEGVNIATFGGKRAFAERMWSSTIRWAFPWFWGQFSC